MIALGLGSNLGDRSDSIIKALHYLADHYTISIERVSSLYETSPVGFLEQPLFLNAVAVIKTQLTPLDLLNACLQTEKILGRIRDIKWGPRAIDIDILFYHDVRLNSGTLILPHPFLHERKFVLEPLVEIAPDVTPCGFQTASQILAQLESTDTVTFYEKLLFEGGRIHHG